MSVPQPDFVELMRRIRAGEQEAAEQLVTEYESIVRREIRLSSNDPRLHRVADSMDVCQSVWSSFFIRAALGQYDLKSPRQLVRLLGAIARNKAATQARRFRAKKRNVGRMALSASIQEVHDKMPSPSTILSLEELSSLLQQYLSEDERLIAELRSGGSTWVEIAQKLGGSPEARRSQMVRAATRLARTVGWED